MYPKELFRNNHYRVVHSPGEDREFQAQGWSEKMDRPREDYAVHHSDVPEDGEAPAPKAAEHKAKPGRPRKADTGE